MKRRLFSAPLFLASVLLTGAFAYAKSFPLTASPAVPAASGNVEVKKDKNSNTEVTIKAEHLAEAGMLTPAASRYVVWFQAQGEEPMNEGQLKVGKDLKGEFKTATKFQNFDVFITAESDPLVKMPSGQTVLKATVQAS